MDNYIILQNDTIIKKGDEHWDFTNKWYMVNKTIGLTALRAKEIYKELNIVNFRRKISENHKPFNLRDR